MKRNPVGFLLALPIVAYHAWAFLVPALKPREKRLIIPSMVFGLLLFSAGALLAYEVALPITIRFLLVFGAEWFTPALTAGNYLPYVFRLLFAFGLVFELPVIVGLLSGMGLVTPKFLRSKRRHAIVGITVLGRVITPGDYWQVTLLLMVPMILLYEASIVLSAVIARRRARDPEAVDASPGAMAVFGVLAIRRWLREA